MARYRFKRTLFSDGVMGAVQQGAGQVVKTTGDVVDSGVGHLASTIGGAALAAGTGPLGMIGGAIAGNIASKAAGKAMHNIGTDMTQ